MKLSVVIPVYNSSKILEKISFEINYYLESKFKNDFELILINDCSIDESWTIIKKLAIKYNFIKPVSFKGSCIFIHLTKNYSPTAGCIAIKKRDFMIMLKLINKKTKIKIY